MSTAVRNIGPEEFSNALNVFSNDTNLKELAKKVIKEIYSLKNTTETVSGVNRRKETTNKGLLADNDKKRRLIKDLTTEIAELEKRIADSRKDALESIEKEQSELASDYKDMCQLSDNLWPPLQGNELEEAIKKCQQSSGNFFGFGGTQMPMGGMGPVFIPPQFPPVFIPPQFPPQFPGFGPNFGPPGFF